MSSDYKSYDLWKRAFKVDGEDEHQEQRARLAESLARMRDKVDALIKTIPGDCKDLTVHDVTHLDALWEMASMIAGPEWDLNPAETFVFGAAVLLHDAGMSAAAFPGGQAELRQTDIWQDSSASALRQAGISSTPELIRDPPAELVPHIRFDVLRALHAGQAEQMASQHWTMPNGNQVYLVDDEELRQAFGSSIGRIAHSHHWSIERVGDTLSEKVGAGIVLPASWAINEKKIAALLRCADAAHIDRRRAPTILFAALRPNGVSGRHWGAQNKINKPSIDGSALVYTSGQPFQADEAEDWWIAYDLVRVVDSELRASNSLLEGIGCSPFHIKRVKGAENPRSLAAHLKSDGWRPVDAEVRVSDPVHLARTLGGSKLYGTDSLAPVRELLQNAADAVRARRALEERESEWGEIRLTIQPDKENPQSCWLHVDDNGIGMTERVMTGPLIDFGKSIWNTSLLREEFPGLQSRNLTPTGRFGIGFFSIFELAHKVRVTSKNYRAGLSEAKTLEFRSLGARPLVRAAKQNELPRDFSTRVSLLVDDCERVTRIYRNAEEYPGRERRAVSFASAILKLVSGLDIKVELLDEVTPAAFVHSADVRTKPGSEFLDELLPAVPERTLRELKKIHEDKLSLISDADGRYYGRAALFMLEDPEVGRDPEAGQVGVGGFVYSSGRGLPVKYVGLIDGVTDEAARRSARGNVPPAALAEWATAQGQVADKSKLLPSHQMALAERILRLGGDSGDLPFCFHEGRLITYKKLLDALSDLEGVTIPLSQHYNSNFKTVDYKSLTSDYFTLPLRKDVIVTFASQDKLVSDLIGKQLLAQRSIRITREDVRPSMGLLLILNAAENVWGAKPELDIQVQRIFESDAHVPPSARWTLVIRRGGPN